MNANFATDRQTFVTHLECSLTGESYEVGRLHGLSRAGRPLLVRYDLDGVGAHLSKSMVETRPADFWRWRELLPIRRTENIVSLGEVETPLVPIPRSGGANVLVKDEGRLPTGSFKARGLVMAVAMAKELGIGRIAMPTNGNAGAALAAYASRAGIETFVFCPEDTPEINVREIAMQGARVWRVNGLIDDCGAIVGKGAAEGRWFDFSTLKEPYRIEGKKTMGLELVEQLGWRLPDVIIYPTGGGVGLIGIYKAVQELLELGWVEGAMPRFVAVQAEGCAPVVSAFERGAKESTFWADSQTVAFGINVPKPLGDFIVLDVLYKSHGTAVAISDTELLKEMGRLGSSEGLFVCPEGAASMVAARQLRDNGWISRTDCVVVLNTGAGIKYPECVDTNLPVLPAGTHLSDSSSRPRS